MFAPSMGIVEDPATGSAAAAFAGYLAKHGRYADGEHQVRIEQGYEMGRPSLMELTLESATASSREQRSAATLSSSAKALSKPEDGVAP